MAAVRRGFAKTFRMTETDNGRKGVTMTAWLKDNTSTIWSWIALIVGAAIVFAVCRGTHYQMLGVGLLLSSIALLVAMAVFELIWQIVARWLHFFDEEAGSGNAPKSRHRKR
jgi:hypothetical protein